MTRQQAIDTAVKRVYDQIPNTVRQCLPENANMRAWTIAYQEIRSEFNRIMNESAA